MSRSSSTPSSTPNPARLATSLWGHLHALTVLGEAGSYTAAAQRLGLSKAAMSQRISELEAATGLLLVRRTTRSVRLTEAGQQLADSTRASFSLIADAYAGVRDQAGEPQGLLRITAPVALARQQLVPRLPAFLGQFPKVRIELEMSDHLSGLASEGFDLAIRHTSSPPETHVAWALCTTRSVLVASPAYLEQRGAPATPQALGEHQCLFYPRRGEAPGWSFEPSAGGGERISVGIAGPLAANNSEALRDAAVCGLGIALLPDFSAEAALLAGQLHIVLPDWQPVGAFGTHLWAIRTRSAQVPRAVQSLVKFLLGAFKGGFAVPPRPTAARDAQRGKAR